MNATEHDSLENFDAAAARLLLDDTEKHTRRQVDIRGDVLFGAWGVAWIVGYLAIWWSTRTQDPYVGPAWWGFTILAVAMVAAVGVTVATITKASAGISGDSWKAGMYYGLTWGVGFMTWQVVMAAVAHAGVSDEVGGLLGGALPALIVAIIYCASAAVWEESAFFVVGAWLAVSAGIGVWTGPSTMALVIGLLGGVGFLAGAVLSRRGRG